MPVSHLIPISNDDILYTNCQWCSEGGSMAQMWSLTSLLKHWNRSLQSFNWNSWNSLAPGQWWTTWSLLGPVPGREGGWSFLQWFQLDCFGFEDLVWCSVNHLLITSISGAGLLGRRISWHWECDVVVSDSKRFWAPKGEWQGGFTTLSVLPLGLGIGCRPCLAPHWPSWLPSGGQPGWFHCCHTKTVFLTCRFGLFLLNNVINALSYGNLVSFLWACQNHSQSLWWNQTCGSGVSCSVQIWTSLFLSKELKLGLFCFFWF